MILRKIWRPLTTLSPNYCVIYRWIFVNASHFFLLCSLVSLLWNNWFGVVLWSSDTWYDKGTIWHKYGDTSNFLKLRIRYILDTLVKNKKNNYILIQNKMQLVVALKCNYADDFECSANMHILFLVYRIGRGIVKNVVLLKVGYLLYPI